MATFTFTQSDSLPASYEDVDPVAMINGDPLMPSTQDEDMSKLSQKIDIVVEEKPIVPVVDTADDDGSNSPEFIEALTKWYNEVEKWERDCVQARIDHKREIIDLKDQMVKLDKEVEEKQQNLNAAKKRRKLTLAELMDAEEMGPQLPSKPQRPVYQKSKDGKTTIKIFKPDEVEDDSWRKIPITQVIPEKTEGLGRKKRETLIEAYPTFGDLEDLRGKASIQHKHFSEVLPAGIGKSLADRLEDLLEAAMRKHMKK